MKDSAENNGILLGKMELPELVRIANKKGPALTAENPVRFIVGIVNVAVVTTLAIDDPEIIPVSPEANIAALAGPPRNLPTNATAKLRK